MVIFPLRNKSMFVSYLFTGIIMNIKWSQLALKMITWSFAEIYLTVIGLDNLADYSEFVFQPKALLPVTEVSITYG